jgi:(S)-sulfolactate dehydrogenase
VRISYAGDLADAPQRPITAAVLKGILSHFEAAPVNAVSAPAMARERGIAVSEEVSAGAHDWASLLTVAVRGEGGEAVAAGTVFGKREARIVQVNQFRLEAVPEGHIILCENDDSPGVVGNIGTTLGAGGVNIARISLSRDEARRAAVSLLNVDQAPGDAVLEALRRLPHVRQVRRIRL